MSKLVPLLKEMCATCPFRKGSPYRHLVPYLMESALSEASRICHSTGTSGIKGNTGKPERLCRGARDVQNNFFYGIGFIDAPTDEAWQKKCVEMKLK